MIHDQMPQHKIIILKNSIQSSDTKKLILKPQYATKNLFLVDLDSESKIFSSSWIINICFYLNLVAAMFVKFIQNLNWAVEAIRCIF